MLAARNSRKRSKARSPDAAIRVGTTFARAPPMSPVTVDDGGDTDKFRCGGIPPRASVYPEPPDRTRDDGAATVVAHGPKDPRTGALSLTGAPALRS
jgi:hypothetical protein